MPISLSVSMATGSTTRTRSPGCWTRYKNDQADMVIGSRFLDISSAIPVHRRAGQEILTYLTNRVSDSRVTDSQSGFRAFSKRAIRELALDEKGMGVESYLQRAADDLKLRIAEVPITCRYNIAHTSKTGPVRHGFTVINTLLKILQERRPLLVFGGFGAGCVIVGAGLGVWVVDVYFRTLQLAIGTSLIGILLLIVGNRFHLHGADARRDQQGAAEVRKIISLRFFPFR